LEFPCYFKITIINVMNQLNYRTTSGKTCEKLICLRIIYLNFMLCVFTCQDSRILLYVKSTLHVKPCGLIEGDGNFAEKHTNF